MGIKTREELEAKIVAEMVAEQDEVTVFEPKTAIRGFITAVAGTVRELWNDLYRMQRKIFLNTASGTDLDELGAERGITRRGASPAGVLLTFTGAANTTIDNYTPVINPSTGLVYLTQDTLTLGIKNPDLVVNNDNQVISASLADTVWALCTSPGTMGNTQVNTITKIDDQEIGSLVSVTNLTPARGGADAESDGVFRERIRNYISVLNQGTEVFYEALCRSVNNRILRIKAKKDNSSPDSIKLIIVTADGVPLSYDEKRALSNEVQKKQRAFTNVILEDVKFTFVTVKERIRLKPGYTIKDITSRTADALSNFFDFRTWEFGKSISLDNVFNACYNVEGIEDIDLGSFSVGSGSLKDTSAEQVIAGNQVATGGGTSTITKSGAGYTVNAFANKFIKVTRNKEVVDAKQIQSNTADTITVYGSWRIIPQMADIFDVMELYRYTAKTTLFIDNDSLPYLDGLEIVDVTKASDNLLITSGIKNSFNPKNYHFQQQNQNQS